MQISLIKGYHLTARQKQLLAFAISNGHTDAHTKQLNVTSVTRLDDGTYAATIWNWETDAWSGRRSKRTSHFIVSVKN